MKNLRIAVIAAAVWASIALAAPTVASAHRHRTRHPFTLAHARALTLITEQGIWKVRGAGMTTTITVQSCYWRTRRSALCTVDATMVPAAGPALAESYSYLDSASYRHHRLSVESLFG